MSDVQAPATKGGSLVQPGRERRLLTVALMLAMGIAALEGTVVVTALPTIVGELQGLTLYPWVFSVYLLTSTTSVPIYGKLADVYGRIPPVRCTRTTCRSGAKFFSVYHSSVISKSFSPLIPANDRSTARIIPFCCSP